jgi:hypothetical protein
LDGDGAQERQARPRSGRRLALAAERRQEDRESYS